MISALEARAAVYDVNTFVARSLSAEYHQTTSKLQAVITYTEAKQGLLLKDLDPETKAFFKISDDRSAIGELWHHALLRCSPGRYQLRHSVSMRQSILEYDAIYALDDKPKQRWTELSRLIEERKAAENEKESTSIFDARSLDFNILHAMRTHLRAQCRMTASIAALRVERYRLEHSRWPNTLKDATGQTPIDARGDAIQYRQTPEGVMVYSIGGNGIDEQGYSQYDAGNVPAKFTDPDDFPVKLYDPELRYSIPPPPEAVLPADGYDWLDQLENSLPQ